MAIDILLERVKALKLYGLINNWDDIKEEPWLDKFIKQEETARSERSLEFRLKSARLGKFKQLVDFDWDWPEHCDRASIENWMKLDFIKKYTNLILCGPNGVGKTTIASNIARQSIMKGHTAIFTTAAGMLNELAALDSEMALRRKIKFYAKPDVLVIDEVGYLSYSNRHADLLFQIINQRYEQKATMITTNKSFGQWSDIFPNATCVVSIVDRLIHHSEIVNIKADSYRLKEAEEQRKTREEHLKK